MVAMLRSFPSFGQYDHNTTRGLLWRTSTAAGCGGEGARRGADPPRLSAHWRTARNRLCGNPPNTGRFRTVDLPVYAYWAETLQNRLAAGVTRTPTQPQLTSTGASRS